MSTADDAAQSPFLAAPEQNLALSDQWRSLRRSATFVALISAPAAFLWAWQHTGLSLGWAIVATAAVAFAFRGALDLVFRRFIPWPSLFGTDDVQLREEDVVNRRRAWFWRQKYRLASAIVLLFTFIWFFELIFGHHTTPGRSPDHTAHAVGRFAKDPQYLTLFVQLPIFFLFNFLIFMGPMMLMGISQIRGFEPGDAEWGVKLDHVRGQAEAKEEVRRIVTLWQSGEAFEKAGGKRERGPPVPRRARHRQDDAREGDRDRLQLAVRLDPGLGLRADVHRHRRDDRALPGPQGEEARPQVGRPVHRLHRRDRRGRHAPRVARRRGRQLDDRHDLAALRGPLLLRAVRRAQPDRRPDPRDAQLARPHVRVSRAPRRARRAGTSAWARSSTRAVACSAG